MGTIVRQLMMMFGAGIVLTYLVAWGCVALQQHRRVTNRVQYFDARNCEQVGHHSIGVDSYAYRRTYDCFGLINPAKYPLPPESIRPMNRRAHERSRYISSSRAVLAGFPFKGLTGASFGEDPDRPKSDGAIVIEAWSHPVRYRKSGELDWMLLPLIPVWPGFILNVASFATLYWLILPYPIRLRARRRQRRGLCPRCKYDIDGDWYAGCPECGWGREWEADRSAPSAG